MLSVKKRAAVHVVGLAGDERCLVRGKERYKIRDVRRLGDATEGNGLAGIRDDFRPELFERDARRFRLGFFPLVHAIGVDRTGTDGIHRHPGLRKLHR